MRTALVAMLVMVGCVAATDGSDDSEAELAPQQVTGKTDAPAFLGLYASHATHHYDGDLPDLELRTDGHFVRQRCYHASCAIETPETDTFDEYTSSSGHHYVRFYGQTIGHNAAGDLTTTSGIADVYEIRAFSKGVQVRKAYSTRWQSLYATTPTVVTCAAGEEFVAGAGGCIANPGANESNCDASNGYWTDDDATLVGSYCICSVGQYLASTGSCAAI